MNFDLKNKPAIQDLLQEMDMEITSLSKIRRQNDRFDIDCNVDTDLLYKLIIYKRILNRILWNGNYASCNTRIPAIISRIKPLISVKTSEVCSFNRTSTTTTTTTTNNT